MAKNLTDRPLSERTILTTGDVARICHVSSRTVCKWIDSGRLQGYRIPGSLNRRVCRVRLAEFLQENGMPDIETLCPEAKERDE